MKYGMIGGFVKLAFAKTTFDYIEKELPGIDMVAIGIFPRFSKALFFIKHSR